GDSGGLALEAYREARTVARPAARSAPGAGGLLGRVQWGERRFRPARVEPGRHRPCGRDVLERPPDAGQRLGRGRVPLVARIDARDSGAARALPAPDVETTLRPEALTRHRDPLRHFRRRP